MKNGNKQIYKNNISFPLLHLHHCLHEENVQRAFNWSNNGDVWFNVNLIAQASSVAATDGEAVHHQSVRADGCDQTKGLAWFTSHPDKNKWQDFYLSLWKDLCLLSVMGD